MAEFPERDYFEKYLAKKLGRLFSGFAGHLLEELENAGWDVNNIPPSVWSGLTQQEKEVLLPFLERVSLQSAEHLIGVIEVGADWALVNQRAADWARAYSTLLAGQIDNTSRGAIATAIRNTVATFFEDAISIQEVRERLEKDPKLAKLFTNEVKDKLGRIYGPYRAEMIAITETTRAAVEGERALVREIQSQGINMVEIWETANDERVCPICEPRHGKKEGDGWSKSSGPPAHPRCRCGVNHEIVV